MDKDIPPGKRIKKIYSSTRTLKSVIFRLILLSLIFACYIGLKFNLELSLAFGLILILFFIISGDENVNIYSDRFVHVGNDCIFFELNKTTFYYSEIKRVDINGYFTQTSDFIQDIIYPTAKVRDLWNHICVLKRNNETEVIKTRLYLSDIRTAVDLINGYLK
jgi:hypothetical protein